MAGSLSEVGAAFWNRVCHPHHHCCHQQEETHYFVMTAKKESLLKFGVLKEDIPDEEGPGGI